MKMKTLLATFAFAFLAVGCVADQSTDVGRDQAELQAADETPTEAVTGRPDRDTEVSPDVQTNCYLFCMSEFQDCIASGSTKQECRGEQRRCITQYCH